MIYIYQINVFKLIYLPKQYFRGPFFIFAGGPSFFVTPLASTYLYYTQLIFLNCFSFIMLLGTYICLNYTIVSRTGHGHRKLQLLPSFKTIITMF